MDTTKEQAYLDAMSNQEFDEAVTNMHNDIQHEISASSLLIDEKQEVLSLLGDYAQDDSQYVNKIKMLNSSYSHVRKTRGDGNCFFRAFGFGYLERMLHRPDDLPTFKKNAETSFQKLLDLNYPSFTVEDFYENFMSVVKSVGEKIDEQELAKIFRDEGMSNYFVVYLRLITSCQLQKEADFYQNFLDGGKSMVEFCKTEVEPMYLESDHIHIIALTSFLGAKVRVAYMDRAGDEVIYHDFPDGCQPSLHLLYRPGHYDIIYPR